MLETNYTIAAVPRRFTRAEYDYLIRLGLFQRERLELIHGILVEMSPIGPPHRTVVDRLAAALLPRLVGRATVSIQQPYAAADDGEPEPDISVVPLADYSIDHPDHALLIVEVADSSLAYNRDTKGPLYASSAVDEYWIVNLVERVVEVYSDAEGGRYTKSARHKTGATIAPRAFPDVTIAVADLLP